MLADRQTLRRRLRKLSRATGRERKSLAAELMRAIQRSRARVTWRGEHKPTVCFPEDLPVVARKAAIAEAVRNNPVVIVCGETGSGKTTQLPKICLELGRGIRGMIGHTQPRRIAARSVAARIAEELHESLGRSVGYKVRFGDRTQENTYIKVMTDGILLAEVQQDRLLRQYDTLIIDEAHERSLNIDFILGFIKHILAQRRDLKVIITSATINPESFARHFDDAPIIEVSGRGYPVEIRYRPLTRDADVDLDLQQGIVDAVDELSRHGPGDMLIFLPTERDIRETAETLRKHHPKRTEVLPLYARLSTAEQSRVFQAHVLRRIVLATNVAETSLTVPGIAYVIDAGTARISRYSVRSKVQRLPVEAVSQASATQRSGRCGRTSPGVCTRLYSEDDFNSRPLFTVPEIKRTNLAAVILQMRHLKLGEIESFPFMDPPDRRYVNDGYKLLEELGAIDRERRLTDLGRQLASLPVDPRLARMVVAATRLNSLTEVLIIVSALAAQDPRERPHEHQQAADEKHKMFADERSDFLSYLKLWEFFHHHAQQLSKTKLRKLCKAHFVSYLRLREWQDVHRQLRRLVLGLGMKENQQAADYASVHRALLSGLLSHIGCREDDKSFLGARNRRFRVFPGSVLADRPPRWVVAANLVETTRLFARTVARIEPQWVEQAAQHLLRREYYEPHWQARVARVAAFQRISLYGLVLVPRRRVDYGSINPSVSREIFIQQALIEGRYRTQAESLLSNRRLINELKDLEVKTRRRDILIAEDRIFEFYEQRLPGTIHTGKAFEKWLQAPENQQQLSMSRSFLLRREIHSVHAESYPDKMAVGGGSFPLTYRFEPGERDDGVTLTVPLQVLTQIDLLRCEWLVPGLLKEKIVELIRALPKAVRKNFVPAPDFAQACRDELVPYEGSLVAALSRVLLRMTGVNVPPEAWRMDALAEHLRLRICVTDTQGKTLAESRDLQGLQRELSQRIRANLGTLSQQRYERKGIQRWDFGTLARAVEIEQAGVTVVAYPALLDAGDHVNLRLLDSRAKALSDSRAGVRRLFLLTLREQVKYLRRNLPDIQKLCLHYRSLGSCDALKNELIETAVERTFLDGDVLPDNKQAFERRLAQGRGRLVTSSDELCRLTDKVLTEHHIVRRRLREASSSAWQYARVDIGTQLETLVYPGFILNTASEWFARIPCYLKAICMRLDKLEDSPSRDQRLQRQVEAWWRRYLEYMDSAQTSASDRDEVQIFRWMIEEYRVSLFAQSLGTVVPVSEKRMARQWDTVTAPPTR